MPVTGIITCRILELEFAWVLDKDPFFDTITIIDDKHSATLGGILEENSSKTIRRIPHIRAKLPVLPEENEALIRVMEIGLHRRQKVLMDSLQKAAEEMSRYSDIIVLGYGTCGNAITEPPDVPIPVVIPIDGDKPVDDCVCLCIGGRKEYARQQKEIPGTYFLTPGWCNHWKEMFDCPEQIDIKMIKRIFRGYKRTLLVGSPVMNQEEMIRKANVLNSMLNLDMEITSGTPGILAETLNKAKKILSTNLLINGGSGV